MAGSKEVEVAPDLQAEYPVLFTQDGSMAMVLRENFGDEGLSTWDLDRITIPAGGGTAWEVPTLEGSESFKAIEGIIVAWRSPRSYWEKPLGEGDEGGSPPDCASEDGSIGVGTFGTGSEENPTGRCKSCPMDDFGSDGGSGKACKEQRLLFFLRPQATMPVTVVLPPTSLRPLRKYLLRLASAGVPYYGATTKLELERVTGKFTYSIVKPSLGVQVDAETRNAAKAYGDAIKALGGANTDDA